MHFSASRVIRAAGLGAAAGTGATLGMSVIMLASRRMGMRAELPPVRIVEKSVEMVRHRPAHPGEKQTVATIVHFGFGAAVGALYGAVSVGVRSTPLSTALGILCGSGVWLVSYQGWIPALGIMPPASRDQPGRVGTMLIAHVVYGALLGIATNRLQRLAGT